MPLAITDIIIRSDEPLTAEVGDEIVMMSMNSDKYYALDEVGSQIWRFIDKPTQLIEICSRLQAEYRVEAEICEQDVMTFAREMIAAGLIEVRSQND